MSAFNAVCLNLRYGSPIVSSTTEVTAMDLFRKKGFTIEVPTNTPTSSHTQPQTQTPSNSYIEPHHPQQQQNRCCDMSSQTEYVVVTTSTRETREEGVNTLGPMNYVAPLMHTSSQTTAEVEPMKPILVSTGCGEGVYEHRYVDAGGAGGGNKASTLYSEWRQQVERLEAIEAMAKNLERVQSNLWSSRTTDEMKVAKQQLSALMTMGNTGGPSAVTSSNNFVTTAPPQPPLASSNLFFPHQHMAHPSLQPQTLGPSASLTGVQPRRCTVQIVRAEAKPGGGDEPKPYWKKLKTRREVLEDRIRKGETVNTSGYTSWSRGRGGMDSSLSTSVPRLPIPTAQSPATLGRYGGVRDSIETVIESY
eukprot:PhF_6_TR3308/c0_g1_i1/m.4665